MEKGGIYEMEIYPVRKENRLGKSGNICFKDDLSVRQGLNLVHILSDGRKQREAETLAAAITGGIGLLPLTAVTFFVMGILGSGRGFGGCAVSA